MGGFFAGSIPSVNISDSTEAGRTLLTSATTQAQRIALDTFVNAVSLGAFPISGNFQRVYIAGDTLKTYAWNGSGYSEVSPNTHTRAGTNNINVGETALSSGSLTGGSNTAVGANSLLSNTTGSNNTGSGQSALRANTTGALNTANGVNALLSNTSGNSNTSIGTNSLRFNTTGDSNTANGVDALRNCTTGGNNTAVGHSAGLGISTGLNNTLVGHSANVDSGARAGCVVLGFATTSPAVDGSLSIGGSGLNAMSGLTTITAPSGATGSYLRIWLNGAEYRIPIQAAV